MKLPNKPSELIHLAMNDLEAVEKNPLYRVDMEVWHEMFNTKCHVCLAGAVMACTLAFDPKKPFFDIDMETNDKLCVLNYLRAGLINSALNRLDINIPCGINDYVEIVDYHKNPQQFKQDMYALAMYLELYGL